MTDFNPRSRKGSDYSRRYLPADDIPISIHAPARGATGRLRGRYFADKISIHAPARGAT